MSNENPKYSWEGMSVNVNPEQAQQIYGEFTGYKIKDNATIAFHNGENIVGELKIDKENGIIFDGDASESAMFFVEELKKSFHWPKCEIIDFGADGNYQVVIKSSNAPKILEFNRRSLPKLALKEILTALNVIVVE